ncbi:hypothetical protein N7456_000086 [Penicillium angulare]|uniref:Uncharacterized protein n=1 Tax=Penicillium angulare TaxID=116970 RepID=A0A9W9GBD8_9EURO|nr:hypothetical protein N7456_000086 [Penicillium angulare]
MTPKEQWSITSQSSGVGPESPWEEGSSPPLTRESGDLLEEQQLLPTSPPNDNCSPTHIRTPPPSIHTSSQPSTSPRSASSNLRVCFSGDDVDVASHLTTSQLLTNTPARDASRKKKNQNLEPEGNPRAPKKARREMMQDAIGVTSACCFEIHNDQSTPSLPSPLPRRYQTERLPATDAADPFNQSLAPRFFPSSQDNPYQDPRGPDSGLTHSSPNTEGTTASRHGTPVTSDPEYLPDSPSPQSQSQARGQTPSSKGSSTSSKEDNSKTNPLCEFSMPCKMGPSPDGMHFRKIVSHVFGRNKASTKLFPDDVWVYFCRKHYQRARYRADQWPFTQCDLLQESLSRIEEWNGVESFELTLRRREVMRVNETEGYATNTSRESNSTTHRSTGATRSGTSRAGGAQTNAGRRHPTAVIAPVPEWLRNSIGPNKTFAEIRAIVDRIREYLAGLRDQERAQEAQSEARQTAVETASRSSGGFRRSKKDKDKDKESQRHQISQVRFPDVEILPRFRDWVIQAGSRKRNQTESNGELEMDVEKEADNDHEEKEEEEDSGLVGRTGRNRGLSASQRRRNDQHWRNMVERVSLRGAVKKPRKH